MPPKPAVWPKWDREASARLLERHRAGQAALEQAIGFLASRAFLRQLEKRELTISVADAELAVELIREQVKTEAERAYCDLSGDSRRNVSMLEKRARKIARRVVHELEALLELRSELDEWGATDV